MVVRLLYTVSAFFDRNAIKSTNRNIDAVLFYKFYSVNNI